jgi:hypothetical protein
VDPNALQLDATELDAWYGFEELASITSLAIVFQRGALDLESVAAFLEPDHLPALQQLDLSVDRPLPRRVWETLARHHGLRSLVLSGRCLGDVALQTLSAGPGLASLHELRLLFGRLSHEGIEALCQAAFARSLELLWLWQCGLDARGLELLCASDWPCLRTLDLSYGHVDTHAELVERRFAALELGLQRGPPDSTGPTPTQASLEHQLLLSLQSGQPIAPRTLAELIDAIDDERFEQLHLHRCQRATASTRAGVDLFLLRADRPQALVFDALDITLPRDFELLRALVRPLHASHVSVRTQDVNALADVDWPRSLPRLVSLRLEPCPRAWRALERALPHTLVELDLSPAAYLWLDEDADLHYLRRTLAARPSLARVRLGSGWWTSPTYRNEVRWALGRELVNGWLELR